MGEYFFYVLYCQDNTLYAGYTTNLSKRLATHNAGKGAKYTQLAKRRPVRMIYAEQWSTKSLAMKAEAMFKQRSRKAKEAYLFSQGVPSLTHSDCVHVDKRQEKKE